MRMHKQAFRGEVKHAKAHPYVQAALNGDPKAAKIMTPFMNNKCVTPNDKFNAVTAAMQLIRFKPDRELIKKPITEEYVPGSLEDMLVSILNNTIDRQPAKNYAHYSDSPRSLYGDDTRQFCHEAEINFIYSALYQHESRNKVYADDEGNPVFLKKFFPRGVATAINFQAVNFDGIELPPGTIVDLKERYGARRMPNSGQMIVNHVQNPQLTAAYPLRLSSFALNEKDRHETFGDYNHRGVPLTDIERQTNIEDIKNMLPKPGVLLSRMSIQQEASDMRYAA